MTQRRRPGHRPPGRWFKMALETLKKQNQTVMPIPAAIGAALISTGGSLVGQGFNAASQGSMNRKTRRWNEKIYGWQRQDALSDWHMQNEYNSPQAQMQRLREAGLNPALIYKNGATNEAGTIRSSDAPSWQPRAPQFDIGGAVNSGLAAYYDTQIKQAQTDNLKAQNTVLAQDAVLKAAQVFATIASGKNTEQNTKGAAFDLSQRQRLADTSANIAMANLRNIEAQTKSTLDENERRAVMQAPNLAKALEDILTMRAQRGMIPHQIDEIKERIEQMKKDGQIKDFEIKLNQLGFTKSDPYYFRVVNKILDGFSGISKDSFQRGMANSLEGLSNPFGLRNKLIQWLID